MGSETVPRQYIDKFHNLCDYILIGTAPPPDLPAINALAAAHSVIIPVAPKFNEIMVSPVQMMKNFNIFDNSGRYEREANTFPADFPVSDKDVLEVISDRDYFGAARELLDSLYADGSRLFFISYSELN